MKKKMEFSCLHIAFCLHLQPYKFRNVINVMGNKNKVPVKVS